MSKTALLVVDLVNDFTTPNGMHYYETTGEMMPRVCGLIHSLHAREILVVYVQQITPRSAVQEHTVLTALSCVEGSGGELLDKRLPISDFDEIVIKTKPSGFFKTRLEEVLQKHGIDTVAIAGTKTNYCVRATATDAMMRDYKVYVLSDCVSTNTKELNAFHLEDLGKYTAMIVSAEELIQRIDEDRL